MLTLMKEVTFTDNEIRHAIEILISECCFPAMNIANALGRTQTPSWQIICNFSIDDIFAEAKQRGLPISDFRMAVGDKSIQETWAKKYII